MSITLYAISVPNSSDIDKFTHNPYSRFNHRLNIGSKI